MDKPYAIVYLIHGQVTPMSLTVLQTLLNVATVDHTVFSIRAMKFGIISYGWKFRSDGADDMEELLAYVTEKLVAAQSGNCDLMCTTFASGAQTRHIRRQVRWPRSVRTISRR